MTKKSVIIIGAGVSGLSSGIHAQRNGFDTHIFEHAKRPGGVSATWKRKGYTIDGGIHFYMHYMKGFKAHDLYRELGVYQEDQFSLMTSYGRFLDAEKEISIDVTTDFKQLEAELIRISPIDAVFVQKFFKDVSAFDGKDLFADMSKPPELTTLMDKAKMFAKMGMSMKYFTGHYLKPMDELVKELHHPFLRDFFCHLFLPKVPLVFVLMILGIFKFHGMGHRKDGSGGFFKAMEKKYHDLNGKTTYQATVEEVLIENGKAVGIRLENGETHRADYVIATGDGYTTHFKLLGGRYVSKKIRNLYDQWPLFTPVMVVNFGIDHKMEETPTYHYIKPHPPIRSGFLSDQWMIARIFNYGPGYAPKDKTLVQLMVDSAFQPWETLRKDEDAYKKEKVQFATETAKALSNIWPGFEDKIEMNDVATPYTFWRYTLSRQGAYEGFAITGDTFKTTLKRTLPGLENFIMAGQWIVPGGGLIPSMLTGRHAAMLLCHFENRSFVSEFFK